MNELEQRMLNLLKDLKENNGAVGLKAAFEDEGATFDEISRLKELADCTGLELTVKLGGCSAVNDMYQAKELRANSIAAPMVESPYSAKKFLNTAGKIFKNNTKFYINIETKYAINFINEILNMDFTGIVFGRTDLACSLGLLSDDVNNNRILEISREISLLTGKSGKEYIIGGGISALSVPFFKEQPYLTKFETRKVVFDAKTAINNHIEEGILKAVDFELTWLKNNNENYNRQSIENKQRIEILKSRFNTITNINKI